MATYVHNADIGTIFELTITDEDGVVIDVSTASTKYIYFQKPDGTKVKETAAQPEFETAAMLDDF